MRVFDAKIHFKPYKIGKVKKNFVGANKQVKIYLRRIVPQDMGIARGYRVQPLNPPLRERSLFFP